MNQSSSIFYVFWKSQIFIHFHQMPLVYTSGQIWSFLTTLSISIQNLRFPSRPSPLLIVGHSFLIKTIKYWITYTISTEVAKFLNADSFFFRRKKRPISKFLESNFVNNNTIVYVWTNLLPFLTFFWKVRFSSIFIKFSGPYIRPNFDFFNDPIDFDLKLRFPSRPSPLWSRA